MATLGETFRSARTDKKLKLAQVAERISIPAERLEALESDRYSELPDDVSMKGAIRNYALFLDLDPNQIWSLYREARPEEERHVPLSVAPTRRTVAVIPAAVASVTLIILVLVALVALHVVVL